MGFVMGLLGGGGTIMAVPILVYLLGLGEKTAIATSFLVVGAASVVATISQARAGAVSWRITVFFGAFAMAGAYLGARIAKFIPGPVLLGAFALIMLIAASLMLVRQPPKAQAAQKSAIREVPIVKLAVAGLGIGSVTGLIGAGGGFIIVPGLVLLVGLPIHLAIGTSLSIISLNTFAGFLGYLDHVTVDYPLAISFTAAAIVGTLAGTTVGRRVDGSKLRVVFALFILIAGTLIFGEQLGLSPYLSLPLAAVSVPIGLLMRHTARARAQKKGSDLPEDLAADS